MTVGSITVNFTTNAFNAIPLERVFPKEVMIFLHAWRKDVFPKVTPKNVFSIDLPRKPDKSAHFLTVGYLCEKRKIVVMGDEWENDPTLSKIERVFVGIFTEFKLDGDFSGFASINERLRSEISDMDKYAIGPRIQYQEDLLHSVSVTNKLSRGGVPVGDLLLLVTLKQEKLYNHCFQITHKCGGESHSSFLSIIDQATGALTESTKKISNLAQILDNQLQKSLKKNRGVEKQFKKCCRIIVSFTKEHGSKFQAIKEG